MSVPRAGMPAAQRNLQAVSLSAGERPERSGRGVEPLLNRSCPEHLTSRDEEAAAYRPIRRNQFSQGMLSAAGLPRQNPQEKKCESIL